MIYVKSQNKPADFDERVAIPGARFLSRHSSPTSKQWARNAFWTRAGIEMHKAYRGICAYSCHWISRGDNTIDHFVPKDGPTGQAAEAYRWENYRLADWFINRRKSTHTIIDPFTISGDWFQIKFPSLLVVPAPNLSGKLREDVNFTIETLELNDESTCLFTRDLYLKLYCCGRYTFECLEMHAPFLSYELKRQNLLGAIVNMMNYDCTDIY